MIWESSIRENGIAPTHFTFPRGSFDADVDSGFCGQGDEHFEAELLPFVPDQIGHAGLADRRHSREGGNPRTGDATNPWIPAFAGMTPLGRRCVSERRVFPLPLAEEGLYNRVANSDERTVVYGKTNEMVWAVSVVGSHCTGWAAEATGTGERRQGGS